MTTIAVDADDPRLSDVPYPAGAIPVPNGEADEWCDWYPGRLIRGLHGTSRTAVRNRIEGDVEVFLTLMQTSDARTERLISLDTGTAAVFTLDEADELVSVIQAAIAEAREMGARDVAEPYLSGELDRLLKERF